jgi:integrase
MVMGERFTNVRVKLPSIAEEEQRYFSPTEAKMIIDAADGQYRIFFELLFATGIRFGEAAGLHVEDLDFKESVIRIRRSTFVHQEVSTKSKAGYREIDVDPEILKAITKYLVGRQSGRIFESKQGTPLVNGNINRYILKPLCKKLRIPIGTCHAFRHGRVSVLQQNGVPRDLIKRWIGHSSLRTTSKYSHFTPEFRKQAASSGIK